MNKNSLLNQNYICPIGAGGVHEGIDLSGMTAVVTGANSGLGFETMRVLALRGAHVIGTGRTLEKAESACAAFLATQHRPFWN